MVLPPQPAGFATNTWIVPVADPFVQGPVVETVYLKVVLVLIVLFGVPVIVKTPPDKLAVTPGGRPLEVKVVAPETL